jgi:hypothetical protein
MQKRFYGRKGSAAGRAPIFSSPWLKPEVFKMEDGINSTVVPSQRGKRGQRSWRQYA